MLEGLVNEWHAAHNNPDRYLGKPEDLSITRLDSGSRDHLRPKSLFIDLQLIGYTLQVRVQLDAVTEPHHACDARKYSESEDKTEPNLFVERHL